MRLIDAEALLEKLKETDRYFMVKFDIEEAPTVEVPIPSGYKLVKRPDYDCSCYLDYPNENHRRKNGHFKCVDDYEYIGQSKYNLTHCRRKKK